MPVHCASRSEFLPEFARPQRDACHSDFLADRPPALRRRTRRGLRHDVNLSPPADPVGRRIELSQKLQGFRFRRWANDVLKRYVLAGVATNEVRLREIGTVVRMLEQSDNAEVAGIAKILNRYSTALKLLDEYDHGTLRTPLGTEPAVQLDYEIARTVVDKVARQFPKDVMFGIERNDSSRGILGAVEQTFAGQNLQAFRGKRHTCSTSS